ncbi:MAG TPA: NAD(P)H-hydrate dehydratase [Rugosimonospora sp.]|nr:NAD(P)H-hydrate dehydratase [Rugosimonospora sp.]
MKVLTAEQMREADRLTTDRYGIPSLQLMENAGAAVADYLSHAFPDLSTHNILVLCGKGNNGGDGLVVARRLRERSAPPRVLLFAEASAVRGDAAANLQRWQEGGGELHVVASAAEWSPAREALGEADLIVDALLGTGVKGPVEGLLASVIEDVNAWRDKRRIRGACARFVCSVDMPSGLPSGNEDFGGPVIRANATVTFTAPKIGQLLSPRADCVGKLIVREIGTPPELLDDDPTLNLHWLEPGEFRNLPMVRKPDANKGSFGHALIVAGSLGKSGAAVLGGRAALRVGAGLVTVATPADVLPLVAAGMPEMMTAPLLATKDGTASVRNLDSDHFGPVARDKSVIAMGPGLSTNKETQKFIRAVLQKLSLPVILDADGLNAFAGHTGELRTRKPELLALTPHPGEMARLLDVTARDVQARRLEIALETAERWQCFVILKGFHTILATPDGRAYVNTTGNAGMATGGTGDVLTGMLAGLTAEFGTKNWERVLGLGVHLHGLAGDVAAERLGEAPLVASDVIEALPEAYARLLAQWHDVVH